MSIIASIFKKILGLFKWGAIKVDSGIDKLYDAQKRLDVVKYETLAALDKQEANAKKIHASKLALEDELSQAEKNLTRFQTQVSCLKNQLIEKGVDWTTNDDLLDAGRNAQEQANFVATLKEQKAAMEEMCKRVDKMLSKLKSNRRLIETKATILASKINFYKNLQAIDENGNIDIDHVFGDIDTAVKNMEYDSKASAHVNAIVNGQSSAEIMASNADVLSYIDGLK